MFQTWKNKISSLFRKNKHKKKCKQINPNSSWIDRNLKSIFKKPGIFLLHQVLQSGMCHWNRSFYNFSSH